jgi:hypothetical protein
LLQEYILARKREEKNCNQKQSGEDYDPDQEEQTADIGRYEIFSRYPQVEP